MGAWSDRCPECGRSCRPSWGIVAGDRQRVDTYRCWCGHAWSTARLIEPYEGFGFGDDEEERNDY